MESSILNAICTKSFLGAEPTLPQKPCKIQEDEATIDAILQILKDDTKEQIGCKLERILPLSSNDESGKEEAPSLFREVLFRINLEGGKAIHIPSIIQLLKNRGQTLLLFKVMLEKALIEVKKTGEPISINTLADDLCDDEFLTYLEEALTRHGIEKSKVIIEVTEYSLFDMKKMPKFIRMLKGVHDAGYRIACDDYGGGDNNINRWTSILAHDIGVEFMKIDRKQVNLIVAAHKELQSETTNLAGEERDIVSLWYHNTLYVIRQMQESGSIVIAEGIENAKIRAIMLKLGIKHGQGWLFDPPKTTQ